MRALRFILQLMILEVAKALLVAGADPNAKARSQVKLRFILQEIMGWQKLLLAAGADPNAKIETGYTPLHDARNF